MSISDEQLVKIVSTVVPAFLLREKINNAKIFADEACRLENGAVIHSWTECVNASKNVMRLTEMYHGVLEQAEQRVEQVHKEKNW